MKNIFKKLVITTSLCSALVLTPITFAGNHTGSYDKCDNAENPTACAEKIAQKMNKRHEKLVKKLGLSESQQVQFKALKEEAKAEREALKPAMKAYREQAKALTSAETFDEQAFITLKESNQDIFAAMALIKAKTHFEMKKILTEEQLVKFKKMMNKKSRKNDK